ncbi:MAG: rRNA maturation RNase YbeY [Armatimonadota bacterium]|nr:rRNA maturation RNase YbeY [Armatimonadota bacterium]
MLDSEDQPPSTIEVLVTDSVGIRELNASFRGIDRVTDVLSFPAGEGPESGTRLLGEIAVCLPIAELQANDRHISLETELACLVVHGGLHLLGYDHVTEDDRSVMIDKMNAIVATCGMETHNEWGSIYGDLS